MNNKLNSVIKRKFIIFQIRKFYTNKLSDPFISVEELKLLINERNPNLKILDCS